MLQAGDAIEVVHRPDHDVNVSTMFRALTTRRDLLPRLLQVDDLVADARSRVEVYLATSERATRPR